MANLSEMELQNLRHLIGGHCTIEKKLNCYADQCTDIQLKDMLKKDANDAKTSKEKLMAENEELRRTIQTLRNQDEARQYDLFKKAKEKGYYIPAQPASASEIATVKQELSQG